MDETVIRIPDLRIIFNENTGAITFPNIKEIPLSRLVDTYQAFGNALRKNKNVLVNRHDEIIGVRQ